MLSRRSSELELVTTRSRTDGMIFAIDAYSGAGSQGDEHRSNAVAIRRPGKRLSRSLCTIPAVSANAQTFNAIGTPFAPEAYRLGGKCALTAGPGRNLSQRGCGGNIGDQSLAIFKQLGRVTVRDDGGRRARRYRAHGACRHGTSVALPLAPIDGPHGRCSRSTDGQIHMVQAYMRLFFARTGSGRVADRGGDRPALIQGHDSQSGRL